MILKKELGSIKCRIRLIEVPCGGEVKLNKTNK